MYTEKICVYPKFSFPLIIRSIWVKLRVWLISQACWISKRDKNRKHVDTFNAKYVLRIRPLSLLSISTYVQCVSIRALDCWLWYRGKPLHSLWHASRLWDTTRPDCCRRLVIDKKRISFGYARSMGYYFHYKSCVFYRARIWLLAYSSPSSHD